MTTSTDHMELNLMTTSPPPTLPRAQSLVLRCSACSVLIYLAEDGVEPPYDFDPIYAGHVWVPSRGMALVIDNGRRSLVPFCSNCGPAAGRLAQQGRPVNLTVLDWAWKLSRAQARSKKEARQILRAIRREADVALRSRSPFRVGLLGGFVFSFGRAYEPPQTEREDITMGILGAYDLLITRLARDPDPYRELTSPAVPASCADEVG